jgi:hypothetical protein
MQDLTKRILIAHNRSSELAAKPSPHINRQDAKSLTLDKSAPADDIVKSYTGKDVLQAKGANFPRPGKRLLSRCKEVGELEGTCRISTANGTIQRNAWGIPSDSRAAAAEAQLFNHALLLGDRSTGNGVQATPEKLAKASQDVQ